jgi:hypothetical protein
VISSGLPAPSAIVLNPAAAGFASWPSGCEQLIVIVIGASAFSGRRPFS